MTDVAEQPWFRDERLQRVLALLNSEGGEARVVGGAVRNSLMGLPVSDMDIATTLLPEQVVERAAAASIKCVPTGLKHGTVTLVVEGKPFEVTTLRRDVETFGRHATVEFTADWGADAARRDLTINALYADKDGVVHDYAGGLADIETATIRFIGSAAERIAEDYLRVLRFFRFFAYYGRGRPDAEGLKASAAARKSLKQLSAERVWSELRKMLAAPDPFRALLWMRTAGVLTEILPESEKWGIDAIPGLIRAEARFHWETEPMLRLASIVPPDAERLMSMADRLRMSGAERQFLNAFASFPAIGGGWSDRQFRRMLYEKGSEGAVTRLRLAIAVAADKAEDDAEALQRLAELVHLHDMAVAWRKPQFPVGGADLMARGMKAGPEIGATLSKLEADWLESDFQTSKVELLAALDP